MNVNNMNINSLHVLNLYYAVGGCASYPIQED